MYLWTLNVHLMYNWEFDCKGLLFFFFQSKGVWGCGNLSFHDGIQSCQFFLESKRLTLGHVKASLVLKAFKSARSVFVFSTKTWLNTYIFFPSFQFYLKLHAVHPCSPALRFIGWYKSYGKWVWFICVSVSLSTWIPCFSRVVCPFFPSPPEIIQLSQIKVTYKLQVRIYLLVKAYNPYLVSLIMFVDPNAYLCHLDWKQRPPGHRDGTTIM